MTIHTDDTNNRLGVVPAIVASLDLLISDPGTDFDTFSKLTDRLVDTTSKEDAIQGRIAVMSRQIDDGNTSAELAQTRDAYISIVAMFHNVNSFDPNYTSYTPELKAFILFIKKYENTPKSQIRNMQSVAEQYVQLYQKAMESLFQSVTDNDLLNVEQSLRTKISKDAAFKEAFKRNASSVSMTDEQFIRYLSRKILLGNVGLFMTVLRPNMDMTTESVNSDTHPLRKLHDLLGTQSNAIAKLVDDGEESYNLIKQHEISHHVSANGDEEQETIEGFLASLPEDKKSSAIQYNREFIVPTSTAFLNEKLKAFLLDIHSRGKNDFLRGKVMGLLQISQYPIFLNKRLYDNLLLKKELFDKLDGLFKMYPDLQEKIWACNSYQDISTVLHDILPTVEEKSPEHAGIIKKEFLFKLSLKDLKANETLVDAPISEQFKRHQQLLKNLEPLVTDVMAATVLKNKLMTYDEFGFNEAEKVLFNDAIVEQQLRKYHSIIASPSLDSHLEMFKQFFAATSLEGTTLTQRFAMLPELLHFSLALEKQFYEEDFETYASALFDTVASESTHDDLTFCKQQIIVAHLSFWMSMDLSTRWSKIRNGKEIGNDELLLLMMQKFDSLGLDDKTKFYKFFKKINENNTDISLVLAPNGATALSMQNMASACVLSLANHLHSSEGPTDIHEKLHLPSDMDVSDIQAQVEVINSTPPLVADEISPDSETPARSPFTASSEAVPTLESARMIEWRLFTQVQYLAVNTAVGNESSARIWQLGQKINNAYARLLQHQVSEEGLMDGRFYKEVEKISKYAIEMLILLDKEKPGLIDPTTLKSLQKQMRGFSDLMGPRFKKMIKSTFDIGEKRQAAMKEWQEFCGSMSTILEKVLQPANAMYQKPDGQAGDTSELKINIKGLSADSYDSERFYLPNDVRAQRTLAFFIRLETIIPEKSAENKEQVADSRVFISRWFKAQSYIEHAWRLLPKAADDSTRLLFLHASQKVEAFYAAGLNAALTNTKVEGFTALEQEMYESLLAVIALVNPQSAQDLKIKVRSGDQGVAKALFDWTPLDLNGIESEMSSLPEIRDFHQALKNNITYCSPLNKQKILYKGQILHVSDEVFQLYKKAEQAVERKAIRYRVTHPTLEYTNAYWDKQSEAVPELEYFIPIDKKRVTAKPVETKSAAIARSMRQELAAICDKFSPETSMTIGDHTTSSIEHFKNGRAAQVPVIESVTNFFNDQTAKKINISSPQTFQEYLHAAIHLMSDYHDLYSAFIIYSALQKHTEHCSTLNPDDQLRFDYLKFSFSTSSNFANYRRILASLQDTKPAVVPAFNILQQDATFSKDGGSTEELRENIAKQLSNGITASQNDQTPRAVNQPQPGMLDFLISRIDSKNIKKLKLTQEFSQKLEAYRNSIPEKMAGQEVLQLFNMIHIGKKFIVDVGALEANLLKHIESSSDLFFNLEHFRNILEKINKNDPKIRAFLINWMIHAIPEKIRQLSASASSSDDMAIAKLYQLPIVLPELNKLPDNIKAIFLEKMSSATDKTVLGNYIKFVTELSKLPKDKLAKLTNSDIEKGINNVDGFLTEMSASKNWFQRLLSGELFSSKTRAAEQTTAFQQPKKSSEPVSAFESTISDEMINEKRQRIESAPDGLAAFDKIEDDVATTHAAPESDKDIPFDDLSELATFFELESIDTKWPETFFRLDMDPSVKKAAKSLCPIFPTTGQGSVFYKSWENIIIQATYLMGCYQKNEAIYPKILSTVESINRAYGSASLHDSEPSDLVREIKEGLTFLNSLRKDAENEAKGLRPRAATVSHLTSVGGWTGELAGKSTAADTFRGRADRNSSMLTRTTPPHRPMSTGGNRTP